LAAAVLEVQTTVAKLVGAVAVALQWVLLM
jgi:hypothetical protein